MLKRWKVIAAARMMSTGLLIFSVAHSIVVAVGKQSIWPGCEGGGNE